MIKESTLNIINTAISVWHKISRIVDVTSARIFVIMGMKNVRIVVKSIIKSVKKSRKYRK